MRLRFEEILSLVMILSQYIPPATYLQWFPLAVRLIATATDKRRVTLLHRSRRS